MPDCYGTFVGKIKDTGNNQISIFSESRKKIIVSFVIFGGSLIVLLLVFSQIKTGPFLNKQHLSQLATRDCGITKRLACCTDDSFPVLSGVDVVSYFQIPRGSLAILGNPLINSTLETKNGNFTFYFSSEENQDLFEENPWAYTPEFGGFDGNALGEENGYFDGASRDTLGPIVDVNQWVIVGNHLYLFENAIALHHFNLDEQTRIGLGLSRWVQWFDTRWASAFSDLSDTVFNTQCVLPIANEEFANDIESYNVDEARVYFVLQRNFALPTKTDKPN